MKKLFGYLKMSWLAVIIFAVIAGVYTGAVLLVPALEGTSFQDIGIYLEWWVIFAVIIVVNCHKGWDAALKCFVFFLISQPLVYLTQIVFGSLDFDMAKSYYLGRWLPITFLTLPGGFIAYHCKKQNALGGIILGLGNTIELVFGMYYLRNAISNFPHHLLSACVCFAAVIIMTLCIQKEKKNRLIAFLLPVALAALLAVFSMVTGRSFL